MGEKEISQLKPKRRPSRAKIKKRACWITFAVVIAFFWMFALELSIRLEGNPSVNLEYGNHYEEPGVAVCLSARYFLKSSIDIPFLHPECTSNLQEDLLGRYTVSYSYSFLGKHAAAQRQVCVIDTVSPELTFSRDWGTNHVDILYGIKATDNYDGDISENVTYIRTKGWVTYSVIDSSGNPTYIVRELPLEATEPPVLQLEGKNPYIITVGSPFKDPGYTAQDSQERDLTEYVVVEGEVDWLTPGTYSLTYKVSDSYENTTSAIREVIVEAVPRPEVQWPENKTIYLTFDDGPGPYTEALLDVLDRYHAKATFFVTNSGYDSVMGEIVRRGHSIGIHTVSHNYAQIYSSPEAYFEDLYAMQEIIFQNTGVMTTLMRFPGGSSNLISAENSQGIMSQLTEAVQDAGFQYFDWNVDSEDASGANNPETVEQNVKDAVSQKKVSIVLQHDIHKYSVDAVESILRWGQENGYTFRVLTERSPGFHHGVKN